MHLWFKYSIIKPEKKSFSRCDDMPYVSGFDRNQLMCCSWDAFVDEESIARIIDAFVEHLDMKKYGVNFEEELDNIRYPSIQTGFDFHRVNNWGGFINTQIFIVHYNRDFTVTRE